MSSHVFHEIYLHLTWHVKYDRPSLTLDVEPVVYRLLTEKCDRIGGVSLHALGGTETHVHLAISVAPHIAPSDVVRELKGYSAHELNSVKRMKFLEWQRGFGVVSFGKRNLPWVQRYIACQKEHHASGAVAARLESVQSYADEDKPA